MTLNEFLYEDEDLFHAYQKAYINRSSFNGWINGMYNYNAYSTTLHNAFIKNKSELINYVDKPLEFKGNHQEEKNKLNLTPLEQDKEFRDLMLKYY